MYGTKYVVVVHLSFLREQTHEMCLIKRKKASFLTRYTWKCLGLGNARIHSIILKFLFEFLPGGYSNELKSILLFIMGTWEHLCCGQIWKSIVKNVKLFKKVCCESLCAGFMKYFTFFLLKNFLDEKLFDWAEKKFLKNF